MAIFVMTFAGNVPASWYALEEGKYNPSTPPWAFSGYDRMRATTPDEAQAEFDAALAAYYDAE